MSSKSVKTSFGLSPLFIVVLALLTAIAPLATDMYLAALPAVAENLNTTSTNASLTLSAFMVGMALGQLVVGPLSDKTACNVTSPALQKPSADWCGHLFYRDGGVWFRAEY